MNYLEFADMCEQAGASMITLHARTRAQGYQPGCRWEAFGELKERVRIPVIANGDIRNLADVRQILDTYGADGVMIGRAALGQPWWIGALDTALKTNRLRRTNPRSRSGWRLPLNMPGYCAKPRENERASGKCVLIFTDTLKVFPAPAPIAAD